MRDYVRGLRTQAELAAEWGISVRQLQRIEDEALAFYLLGIARAMREAIGDHDEIPPCRISENRVEHAGVVSRAVTVSTASRAAPGSGQGQRARLPSRWKGRR